MTGANDQVPGGEPRDVLALKRVLRSFDRLVGRCEDTGDRQTADASLAIARELYGPVRELADEVRRAHGDVPSIRLGLARLDQTLR